jgi:hypothetical protein
VTCQGEHLLGAIRLAGEKIETDESLRPLRTEFLERKALADEADSLLDETKEELKTRLGDRGAVYVAGRPIYFRPQTAMLWDSKALAQRYDALRKKLAAAVEEFPPAESFKKESVSRPLRVYG